MKPLDFAADTGIGTMKDYIEYRLKIDEDDLSDAKLLFSENRLRSANSRAYYAIFHAISTIHALDGRSFKSHKQSIAAFNVNYIHKGIFPKEYGHKIAKAQEKRHSSDYDYSFCPTVKETAAQIDFAVTFVQSVKDFCLKEIEKRRILP